MRKISFLIVFILILSVVLNTVTVNAQAEPSTWSVTDGLGRTAPLNNETVNTRKDRYVAMFFWDWHTYFKVWKPYNVNNIIEEHPEAANDFNNSVWGNTGSGVPMFWNEPIYGYYTSTDKYVIRKQAELLADAGVDVIFFDCTNDTLLFTDAFKAVCETFTAAKEEGVNVPKVGFMLNINPTVMMENNKSELKTIYKTIYKKNLYSDLWFYWEGKPLVLSTAACLDENVAIEKEILDFFTFRRSDDCFDTADTSIDDDMWGWLSVYPQTKYGVRSDGTVEEMCVGIAQNYSNEHHLTAMNDPRGGVHGRSYSEGKYSYTYSFRGEKITVDSNTPDSSLYGINFQQQWDYAISVDPDIIFITGWNEWIAGRWDKWIDVTNAFPDEYNDEYSRDIEPSKGKLKDHYYNQLVMNIRRYKGTEAQTVYSDKNTVDINDLSSWDNVSAVYEHYTGSTLARSADGYGGIKYKEDTMRNDITLSKVAYDDNNVYFYVETKDDLTVPESDNWMRLFLDTDSVNAEGKDWESFEYMIGDYDTASGQCKVLRSTGGWNWEEAGKASFVQNAKSLVISVARADINLSSDNFRIDFKWSDNCQNDGDVMDFYTSGDCAPGARFKFVFSTEVIKTETNSETAEKTSGNNTLTVIAICSVAAAAAAFIVLMFLLAKNRNKG